MFKIINPCHKTWADLAGDGRQRFCADCGKHVHAMESYSPQEQQALAATGGRLCIMEATAPLPQPTRRALFAMSVLAAARPLWAQIGSLRMVVVDITGGTISGAEIQVRYPGQTLLARALTSADGKAALPGMPIGRQVQVSVQAPGFSISRFEMMVRSGDETEMRVELKVGLLLGEAVSVEPHAAPREEELLVPAVKQARLPDDLTPRPLRFSFSLLKPARRRQKR